jgi:hypothetical protein
VLPSFLVLLLTLAQAGAAPTTGAADPSGGIISISTPWPWVTGGLVALFGTLSGLSAWHLRYIVPLQEKRRAQRMEENKLAREAAERELEKRLEMTRCDERASQALAAAAASHERITGHLAAVGDTMNEHLAFLKDHAACPDCRSAAASAMRPPAPEPPGGGR